MLGYFAKECSVSVAHLSQKKKKQFPGYKSMNDGLILLWQECHWENNKTEEITHIYIKEIGEIDLRKKIRKAEIFRKSGISVHFSSKWKPQSNLPLKESAFKKFNIFKSILVFYLSLTAKPILSKTVCF